MIVFLVGLPKQIRDYFDIVNNQISILNTKYDD